MKNLYYLFFILLLAACQEEGINPECKITAPQNNAEFKKGDKILVEIEAFDDDGLISEIGIMIDQLMLEKTTNQPFQFEISTGDLSMGEHTVSVYAVDNSGLNSSDRVKIILSVQPAKITSDTISEISIHSAFCSASIIDSGGGEIEKKGFCWSTTPKPDIEDFSVEISDSENVFTGTLDSLESNTFYYVRAFAKNENGVSYGNELIFKTPAETGTFTDSRDNTLYKTVKIAGKWWMAENLRYLPNVTIPTTGSDSVGYRYVYNQTACGCMGKARANINYKTYGTLYNYTSAIESVPEGWHIPSHEEWQELFVFMSKNTGNDTTNTDAFENIGPHCKAQNGWQQNTACTNDYGFGILPGGKRDAENSSFTGVDELCFFWTDSVIDNSMATAIGFFLNDKQVYIGEQHKSNGFSVRCVKD